MNQCVMESLEGRALLSVSIGAHAAAIKTAKKTPAPKPTPVQMAVGTWTGTAKLHILQQLPGSTRRNPVVKIKETLTISSTGITSAPLSVFIRDTFAGEFDTYPLTGKITTVKGKSTLSITGKDVVDGGIILGPQTLNAFNITANPNANWKAMTGTISLQVNGVPTYTEIFSVKKVGR